MKMVRNKVNMSTELCGFMKFGWLQFWLSLENQIHAENFGTVTTVVQNVF